MFFFFCLIGVIVLVSIALFLKNKKIQIPILNDCLIKCPDNSVVTCDKKCPTIPSSCNKEENCCSTNEDCKYIWYTGVCNTPEYVAKRQKEAEAQGIRNGEAPPRENVTCSCESNKCITYN